jgi:hypothetical protein
MRAKTSQFRPLMMLAVLLGAGTNTQAYAATVLPAPEILPGQTQSTEFVEGFATSFLASISSPFRGTGLGPSGTFSESAFLAPRDNPFGANYLGFAFQLSNVAGAHGVTAISIPGWGGGLRTAVANCQTGTCSPFATGASFPTSVARSSIGTDDGNKVAFSWGSSPLTGNSGLFIVYSIAPYLFFAAPSIEIFGANGHISTVSESIAPITPLPAALPLFATGLGALGLFGWLVKRKNTAALRVA